MAVAAAMRRVGRAAVIAVLASTRVLRRGAPRDDAAEAADVPDDEAPEHGPATV